MHPMKGPMVTQTLRGMAGNAPFHWRGDKGGYRGFQSNVPPNLLAADLFAGGGHGRAQNLPA